VPEEMTAPITEDAAEEVKDVTTPEQALHMINEAVTVDAIGIIFKSLPTELQKNKEVIQFCKDKKTQLTNNQNQ
jgi:hypothetical protein